MIPQEWLKHAPVPPVLDGKKSWHVFLSYRSVNRGWVLNLYDILTELGFKVFLDQYVLKPGDSLARTLEDGLQQSQAGILIWSNSAKDSEWVRNEYDVMISMATNDKSFCFVPIKIDRASLPVFANTKLFLDFTEYPDGPNGGDLLRLVHALLKKPLSDEAVHFAWEQDEESGIASAKITAAIRNKRPEKLIQLFNESGLPWKTTASLSCKAAEGLIKLGKEDEAIDMLEKIEKDFSKAIRPKQLKALALARRGKGDDLDDAMDILGLLYALNNLDPETLGIYGRTWMDKYNLSKDITDLQQSRNYYLQAFERSPDDYYTGINAASKSIFLGEFDKATEIADKIQEIVGSKVVPGDYWQTATVAEAFLIKKQFKEAGEMYQQAVDMAPTEIKSHESTYKQAKLVLDKMEASEGDKQLVLKAFKNY
ncbi:toll/interleukin-1 receptor domain-containing protein [Mucilaginibacter endophyticus]|uniref:toll/interleukin-1 receptor domain-containing protein n=1 Tax=Mucilaginibacter endophyticus TaxID=2675003 RepID=UPI000E0CD650|nr:toll/interleukin-1 receptor domain-containing protein [Mucilaginibacter endophyticus]